MAIDKILVSELLRSNASTLVLDVRSPSEYKQAHFPGALHLPLFSDEERKIIGTSYKQDSREKAVRIGLDFFGPKMKPLIDEVVSILENKGLPKTDPVHVYCWRGGMRSGAVAWLLDLYGIKVRVLSGGYKSFRRWSLDMLLKPQRFQILGGYTGSDKTGLLRVLESQGESVIDLEGLAGHRGSAFGNLERIPQPSQEMFENMLAIALYKENIKNVSEPERRIWLEDESQRIGSVNIPNASWQQMRSAPVSFLDIPFEERLNFIVGGYGSFDSGSLTDAIARISKRLGGLETKNAVLALSNGDVKAAFSILLHYYDKLYFRSLHNREGIGSLLTNIRCDSVSAGNVNSILRKESAAS